MNIDDNGKSYRKMSLNLPFYRQPFFIPIAALISIILILQLLPSRNNEGLVYIKMKRIINNKTN